MQLKTELWSDSIPRSGSGEGQGDTQMEDDNDETELICFLLEKQGRRSPAWFRIS